MEVRKAGVIDNSESHWSNPILMTRFLRTKLPDSFTCKSWVLTCPAATNRNIYIYILCMCSFIRTYDIWYKIDSDGSFRVLFFIGSWDVQKETQSLKINSIQ